MSARLSPPTSGDCCAEGGHEGKWLHSLALAAVLLERIPSVRARIAGANGGITCAEVLSRKLIMPAITESLWKGVLPQQIYGKKRWQRKHQVFPEQQQGI